jgi:hypothetical protein
MLRPTLALAGALALTACSGAADRSAPATTPSTTVVDPAPETEEVAAPEATRAEADSALAASAEWFVRIDVAADGFAAAPLDTAVEWTGEPDATVADGPFGRFGSCSGLREHVASYSVFVSGADAAESVSVWTADRVTGPGIFDAEVRVEQAGEAPIAATGTITILDGLQDGEFVAFGADGGRVEGTFACSGAAEPTPLATADEVDASGSAEVFALLRDGDSQRIVGMAADAERDVECPATGRAGGPVLAVAGSAALGAITAFELSGSPTGAGLLRVAGTDYEFPDVTVTLDDSGTSGVFSGASPDGTSVDGAFRCD